MTAEKIITNYPRERVISMMCESGIGDFEEASGVAYAVLANLRNSRDIIPSVVRHRGFGLASRCLVSLGFFFEYMQHLTNNHGYPAPEFYAEVGKTSFIQEGRKDIAEHFENWTSFFHERFRVKTKQEKGIIAPIIYERVSHHRTYQNSREVKPIDLFKIKHKVENLEKNSIN